ncbi:hypothetical protein EDC01DRAFT_253299 [Geopyxis carbonaria]|nr:hypothetical protein EDC01DRAFT_253299 [Geopyxis carbonaria]
MSAIPNHRSKKPNYNQIHKHPLPLLVQPFPTFVPHNPLSLLCILYSYLFRSSCQPEPLYCAQFDPKTLTVHVTDPRSVLALWNSGFFGKGSLSRSEPTWLSRRRRALGLVGKNESLTAEELTEQRRRERREFKFLRARAEKEQLQSKLFQEGRVPLVDVSENEPAKSVHFETSHPQQLVGDFPLPADLDNLEHLQLTFEETFFLAYGIGALKISESESKRPIGIEEMFRLFRQQYSSPTSSDALAMMADNQFILNYVVYHHFRSLGWVVRSGVKFSVDYLLYNRGPVFTHAEYAVLIVPSYSSQAWASDLKQHKEMKQWHWLHCANRVSAQVKKTIILVYVDIPPPNQLTKDMDIAQILKKYRIREFSMRRWLVSRNRD